MTLITNLGLMKMMQRKSLKGLFYETADDAIRIERASGPSHLTAKPPRVDDLPPRAPIPDHA